MRRMPLSADTAVKLAKHLNVPLEHLMHMPQHILIQKLAELAKAEQENNSDEAGDNRNNRGE
ncbi:YycC family protein [Cohnella fermenti]|uniref:YycC family protein n=1 Tax=Cohnella fermenti TaxID=2565925 RepID=A0A4S4BHJ1_9BACL|nr:YycC family protein [Cohnella fermenti]THF73886.1 YycC family protein [Cohnella fermenti]